MYSYSTIIETLLTQFTEIQKIYSEDLAWISDTFKGSDSAGQTVVFDRCFCNYVECTLKKLPMDKTLATQIFAFMESMAKSEDADVRDLLQVTVLEYLRSSYDLQNLSEKMMGCETAALFQKVKEYTDDPIILRH